jgi:nucleoid-associated protein YgaU
MKRPMTVVPSLRILLGLAAATAAFSGCQSGQSSVGQPPPPGNPYGNPAGYEGRASGYPSDSDYVDVAPDPGHRAPSYESRPAYQPSGSGGGGSYTVAKGDTLYAIARRHGTTVPALKGANGLTEDTIRIGQVLRLP